MVFIPSIPEKIATVQAYIRELQRDVSCLPEMKRELAQLSTEMERLREDCERYDAGCDDVIRVLERQKNMEKRVESLAGKIKALDKSVSNKTKKIDELLKDYPVIAHDFKITEEMKKEAMKYIIRFGIIGLIAMLGVAIGVNIISKLLGY